MYKDEIIRNLGSVDLLTARFNALFSADLSKSFFDSSFSYFVTETLKIEHLEAWQIDFIACVDAHITNNRLNVLKPFRYSVASGHGVGKTALSCWFTLWLYYTRDSVKGVISAVTEAQLKNKLWVELKKWAKLVPKEMNFYPRGMCLYNANSIITGVTCREENSESFAGQHNLGGSSFYIFDEASAVSRKVFEVAEGGLTDGESFILVFGNPTRSTGYFYDIHHSFDHWNTVRVSSEDISFTNKSVLADWEKLYGRDSDFYRVRVLGNFPIGGSDLFYPLSSLRISLDRAPQAVNSSDVKSLGVDVARTGVCNTVLASMYGSNIRVESILAYKDLTQTSEYIIDFYKNGLFDVVIVDDNGVGGGLTDMLRKAGLNVIGSNIMSVKYNKKKVADGWSHMNLEFKKLLNDVSILGDTAMLVEEMRAVSYSFDNARSVLQVVSKKDLVKDIKRSPDSLDAVLLNFAINRVRLPREIFL